MRHAGAITVLAGNFHIAGHAGDGFQPVFGGAAAVIAGATGQDQHALDVTEHVGGFVTEQRRRKGLDAFQRIGQRTRLLEDFLLHVVAVGAEFGGTAVRVHRLYRTVGCFQALTGVFDPVLAWLQVDHVAFFQIDDLVGHAGQCHGIAGQVVGAVGRQAQDQRRTGAATNHAIRLVTRDHCHGIGAVQARQRFLHRHEQVAVVDGIDQVGNHLGIGLAVKLVALGTQFGAQLLVVFDDAVVHQRDTRLAFDGSPFGLRAKAEMRVCVVRGRHAVRGPARVRDAGIAAQAILLHLLQQLGDTGRAAGALQTVIPDSHAAGVIAAVLQALQALHQHRHHIVRTHTSNDSAHSSSPRLSGGPGGHANPP